MSINKRGNVTLVIVGLLVLAIGVALFLVLPSLKQSTTALSLGNGAFDAQVITDYSEITKGISGVTEFKSSQAVLMIYPKSDKWSVVVDSMRVSIDLVWLNENKQVVYYAKDIEPADTAKTFTTQLAAKYVVELAGGTIDKDAIKIASVASFDVKTAGGE
jgi:uncharacterized membrane protein (UPF0127 family)